MESSLNYKLDIALLLVRLGFGIRLIYGTIDNILSWSRMLEFKEFLEANHFPLPLVCAVASVYIQFFAGISWITGYKVRLSAVLMTINFLIAVIGVHLRSGDSYLSTAPAIHLMIISILLFCTGSGRYGLDQLLTKRKS